jgi:GNAT superfamily N-acetyltransferase
MSGGSGVGVSLRPAQPSEAPLLSALALRAKASHGYSADFIAACRAELTYAPSQIDDRRTSFVVAECGGVLVGFYALEHTVEDAVELEALFVDPERSGRGIGRLLMDHARRSAAAAGAHTMLIQSDPNAEAFYRAAGAVSVGTRESGSIPGRYLPLLAVVLRD